MSLLFIVIAHLELDGRNEIYSIRRQWIHGAGACRELRTCTNKPCIARSASFDSRAAIQTEQGGCRA
jgi:hypothetical protein